MVSSKEATRIAMQSESRPELSRGRPSLSGTKVLFCCLAIRTSGQERWIYGMPIPQVFVFDLYHSLASHTG